MSNRVSFTQEYIFKASPHILHKFLTMPDCIIRWFCDECKVVDDYYVYHWEDEEQIAHLIDDFEEELIRFHWEDTPKEELLEFKIYEAEVTNETILELTAWCEEEDIKEEREYWNIQMENLRRATGAF